MLLRRKGGGGRFDTSSVPTWGSWTFVCVFCLPQNGLVVSTTTVVSKDLTGATVVVFVSIRRFRDKRPKICIVKDQLPTITLANIRVRGLYRVRWGVVGVLDDQLTTRNQRLLLEKVYGTTISCWRVPTFCAGSDWRKTLSVFLIPSLSQEDLNTTDLSGRVWEI